jgi:hypothetical protein
MGVTWELEKRTRPKPAPVNVRYVDGHVPSQTRLVRNPASNTLIIGKGARVYCSDVGYPHERLVLSQASGVSCQ